MAKRFTDTGKWKNKWFRTLPYKGKLLWLYLCDMCDIAGIWDKDLDLASFQLGFPVTDVDIRRLLGGKVAPLTDTKCIVIGFIPFQYNQVKAGSKIEIGINKILIKYGLSVKSLDTLSIPYTKGIYTLQDQDQDQDKDQDQDCIKKEGGMGEENKPDQFSLRSQLSDGLFEQLWKLYPRHDDKSAARLRFDREIKTAEQCEALTRAITKYKAACTGKERQFVKLFSSFIGSEKTGRPYRDILEPGALDHAPQASLQPATIAEALKLQEELTHG